MHQVFKICIACLCMYFTGIPIHAQNYMNVLNLRHYFQPGITLQDSSYAMSLSETRFEAVVPIQLKSGSAIGIKPQFKAISLKSEKLVEEDLSIYSIKLPVFALIKWGDSKWSSYFDLSPKLNTDFDSLSSRHFQLGGMFLAFYERKKDFFWQFGVYYNQDTYGPFIMPLVGIDWKIDARNYLALLIPAYGIYEYRLSEKIYLGIELELTGETYRLGGSAYPNSFISQVGENKLTFLTEPRLFLDYYLSPNWVFYFKPGFRFFQKYEHFTVDDIRITDSQYLEGTLKNNFYVEFGVAMRFRYDEVAESGAAQLSPD